MKQEYEVHCRDPLEVVRNILMNTEFDGSLDFAPYKEYGTDGQHQFHNFMSANWAYDEAVCFFSLTVSSPETSVTISFTL